MRFVLPGSTVQPIALHLSNRARGHRPPRPVGASVGGLHDGGLYPSNGARGQATKSLQIDKKPESGAACPLALLPQCPPLGRPRPLGEAPYLALGHRLRVVVPWPC